MDTKTAKSLTINPPTAALALKSTFRCWPVIAIATIGLCFVTKTIADWLGFELPDQANIALVKNCLLRAFDSRRALYQATFLIAQIIVIMPVLEELIFRGLLFKLPSRFCKPFCRYLFMTLSSALFSAAHYLAQPWPDAAFLALFFFGCAQCWLYRRTDRLWCPMLNHALFNLTNLILLFLIPNA